MACRLGGPLRRLLPPVPATRPSPPAPGGALGGRRGLLWSVPIYLTLRIGQINALIWLLVLVDVLLARAGRRAGYLTGIATAIKLTPLGLVLFFVALQEAGRRRPAARRVRRVHRPRRRVAPLDEPRLLDRRSGHTGRVGTTDSGYNNSLWRLTSSAPAPVATSLGVLLAIGVAAATVVGCARGRPATAGSSSRPGSEASPRACCRRSRGRTTCTSRCCCRSPSSGSRCCGSGPTWRCALTGIALLAVFEVGDVGQDPPLARTRAALLTAVVLGVGLVGLADMKKPRPAGLGGGATPTGLEPATSAVTGRRANQLRYGALTGRRDRAPNGIRTRAAALKGRSPRPLDDGDAATRP